MTKLSALTIFEVVLLTVFLSVFYLCGISCSNEHRGVSENEIRIGYIPDFTGPSARGCRGHLWGMENYFNEINAKGGIYGRKIKLFIQDGKYNPSIGISAFKKLVLKEKVFAMISLYDLHGITYAKTLVKGLKGAGRDLSVEGLVDAMEQIKDWDNGGQAPVSFGPENRQGVTKVVIFRGSKEAGLETGRWEIIKTWTAAKNSE